MKCGLVAVIGRANAGKSTLVNVLVGEKVSIVSPKPQTTRDRILGIANGDNFQIVFEDTPGIYKASTLLNERMQKSTGASVKDVDLILFVADVHEGLKSVDIEQIEKYAALSTKIILVLSKIDIMPQERLPEELQKISHIDNFLAVIPVSARKGKNIPKLKETIIKYLPENERMYSLDVVSNRSERFMVAEIMREKILLKCDKEIPHGVAIVINEFKLMPNGVYDINLDVVCEKQNHKAIIIGKGGAMLKEINGFARTSMEKFLDAKVFLTVFVKVREGWRDNPSRLKEYGYGNDELKD